MQVNPTPVISQALELSTIHISDKTAKWLNDEVRNFIHLLVYDKSCNGWFIRIDNPNATHNLGVFPPDLQSILSLATQYDCSWLIFDKDGPMIPELPTFQ
jgi:hypothetical protein